jgi:hypothetical protein
MFEHSGFEFGLCRGLGGVGDLEDKPGALRNPNAEILITLAAQRGDFPGDAKSGRNVRRFEQ